ncbi:MAG: dTDP-4-dehydrorhamnose 3,5-epimerase [Gammaproteobacteria bacterium]|jgi:dTDP-4-dehydrorhamnose 3,5-epimerase|nr:dTDP-4-dehydrorhamnose 3,5-epimerase [Gammaproteobacteria bacterium]
MNVIKTALPGVLRIQPTLFGDERGFFIEHFHALRYRELAGIDLPFVQDNMSRSEQGVLRGLHYQLHHTQGKLIWLTQGAVFDVIVDVRYGSPAFGRFITVELQAKTQEQIYIPPGFAHGFCALTKFVDFQYKCTDYYDPASEITIQWNDPDLNIPWPITNPIVSQKDKQSWRLRDLKPNQLPLYRQV